MRSRDLNPCAPSMGAILEVEVPRKLTSARAKTLPSHDRAHLAEDLLDSLQGDSDVEAADAAWDLEIARRVAEIEAGTVKLISAEDVYAEARRLIRR